MEQIGPSKLKLNPQLHPLSATRRSLHRAPFPTLVEVDFNKPSVEPRAFMETQVRDDSLILERQLNVGSSVIRFGEVERLDPNIGSLLFFSFLF